MSEENSRLGGRPRNADRRGGADGVGEPDERTSQPSRPGRGGGGRSEETA
ncbi:hypothetical protein [Plantactinospora endophytica]|nr:hypothetical protein [Plantactinospora endophytica]